jgi:cytochrome c-type biogenesis protein CcmE
MKTLKKKRRVQIIALAAVALVVSTALIGYAMRDGINFFRSPTQVVDEPPAPTEVFRIGGLVEDGSLVRGDGETIRFNVTVLPDLFEENQGMVGMGSYRDGVFEATEILAKHDEDYMPKEVVDSLKEQGVYQEPEKSSAGYGGGS